MSSRNISVLYNLERHQQRCVHKIFQTNPNPPHSKIFDVFSTMAAIRFSSHSMTKSKISISCVGKTGRRYVWRLFKYKMVLLRIVYVFILQAAECYSPNPCFLIWKIKNTMVGLIQRRTTKFQRTGEMSRRRRLCITPLQILSSHTKP